MRAVGASAARQGIPVWRAMGTTPVGDDNDTSVAIVGGGPVGLSLALDLGRRGHRVVVLNKLDCVAAGSKAICFAKRTLDIWNRMGVGQAMVDKGVIWNVGKVFWGAREDPIYQFDMQPLKHQKMPGFINLQQYHAEDVLIEALSRLRNVELRWGHEVVGVEQSDAGARIDVRVGDEGYRLDSGWILACDGARSSIRELLGLDFDGRVFEDNFLIADIKVKEPRAAERWFWFDPPFNPGQSALLHKQPDDVWRLDFQLGWNIDRAACVLPENVEPLVRGMLGDSVDFTEEWYSVYTFQCRRMERFVHDRVIFAGDSAHLVSPFGARGCNGGIADADNLAWKLDLVLTGAAPRTLLDSFDAEAIITADENIRNSSRSTDFMSPKSPVSRALRDAVLELAGAFPFARPFVNSGRLSTAVAYPDSALSTPDEVGDEWAGIPPGSPAVDAPVGEEWLLDHLGGGAFTLVTLQAPKNLVSGLRNIAVERLADRNGMVAARYDLRPGSAYLLRPDQYVAARWRNPTPDGVEAALRRAKGIA